MRTKKEVLYEVTMALYQVNKAYQQDVVEKVELPKDWLINNIYQHDNEYIEKLVDEVCQHMGGDVFR